MTILCVDDEQLVLDHTLSLCRELPQKLDPVGFLSAEEALVWLKNHKPDLALIGSQSAEYGRASARIEAERTRS